MSEGAKPRRRNSNASSDRRPLRFWEPFNIWWRSELQRTGKRATSDEIATWYEAQSGYAWGPEKPSLQETRTHAKCLRSVSSVRDYFREYRAKKKHEQSEMDDDDEEEDDRRSSRSNASRGRGSRSKKQARSTSTAACSGGGSMAMPPYLEHSYWGSGFHEGAVSGVSTAAGQAAAAAGGDVHQAAAQAVAEYEQQMAALGMAYMHPGALDLAWPSFQQAAAAAGAAGSVPTIFQQSAQLAGQQQQQSAAPAEDAAPPAAGAGTDAGSARLWQQPGGADLGNASQQQEQTQQQGLDAIQIPQSGPAAGQDTTLHSLMSPGLQQLASMLAFQAEMPLISPRMQAPAMQGVQHPALGSPSMGPPGAVSNLQADQQGAAGGTAARSLQPGTTATQPGSDDAQRQQLQAAPTQVPIWAMAAGQQYHMPQYGGGLGGDFPLGLATTFGGLSTHMQQPQQHASTAAAPPGARRPVLERPFAQPAAGAPAPAPQAKASQPPGSPSDAAPTAQQEAGATGPAAPPDSTHHGVIPASLLAAVPLPPGLPGCPGHSTVDSILRQLESGARTPRGFAAAAAAAGGAGGQQPFPRMSLSAMLEAPSLMLPGASAARQLAQSFEQLPLAQQRLSLYAMGSGMLDMLSEGLDLDAFLGTSGDLSAAGAGAGASAHGADPAAAYALGGSLMWLRTSGQLHMPEHWQQHLQALQEEPVPAPGGHSNTGLGAAGVGPAAGLQMLRTSSANIEAAIAALTARPELMQDPRAAAPGQPGPHAGGQGAAEEAMPPAGHRKRVREELQGADGRHARAEMGPPASGNKRSCAGTGTLGISVPDNGSQRATEGSKGAGFKFVLDLATPKPGSTLLPVEEQQQAPQARAPDHKQQARAADSQLEAAAVAAVASAPKQDPSQKRPVVLDLRPEELGATSENTPAAAKHATAPKPAAGPCHELPQQQVQQLIAGTRTAAGGVQGSKGGRRVEGLMLPPLQSPAADAAGNSTRGALHLGPATAASTTAAPPRVGPGGEVLPAPAMSQVEMAAAMQATAATTRPLHGQHVHAGGRDAAQPMAPPAPSPRLLPAMHEIERMI